MITSELNSRLRNKTSGKLINLKSAKLVQEFIDDICNECIESKTFDDNVRNTLNDAMELLRINTIDGLHDAVNKLK